MRMAVVALLAAALIFGLASSRDPGYARIRLAGAQSAGGSHAGVATVVVEAAPFSLIELSVNGRRAASVYAPASARPVRFEDTPLAAGSNRIVARTTLWYAAARRVHTAVLAVDDLPATAAAGARRAEGVRLPPAPTRNARALSLRVREQQIAAAFTVRLASTDRAAVALRAGRIDLPAFVDDVFGAPRFNRKRIAEFFAAASPQFDEFGSSIEVSADADFAPVPLEDLPAFAGEVDIANAFTGPAVRVGGGRDPERAVDPRRWAQDELHLSVADYRVADPQPAPARTDGAGLLWNRPFDDLRSHVGLSLAYTPFASLGALRRGLNLPVFAYLPHVAARFLAFFHGFVLAIPMFAYLLFARGRDGRFATVARRLIAVAVAADVFAACISAQPDVDGEILMILPALRAVPSSLVNLLFVPALIGFVLAGLAASVAGLTLQLRSRAGRLVGEAADAVRVAALAFAAIVAVGFALKGLMNIPFAYPLVVGAALAAGLIAILIALDWWTIPAPGTSRAAFTLATVVLAVAIAMPTSLVAFGAWATIPEHAGTAFADPLSPLPLTAAFLRSLAPLCSLVFGLLLICGTGSDPLPAGLTRAAFARLALCAYAVPAGVIAIVPLGFVLAWWTYDSIRDRQADGPPARRAMHGQATPRERGLAAIPFAIVFALIEALLLMRSESWSLGQMHTPFIVLEAAAYIAVIVASFVVPGFAFAAYAEEFAGQPGLERGMKLGAWVVACSVPGWFLQSESLTMAVWVALLTALFYGVLGYVGRAPARVAIPT